MKVVLLRSYRSKNGNVTFVYAVSGNAEDLAKFKEIQGGFYREDDNGQPLWFTVNCIGQTGKLIITTNNKIVPDMSAFDQAHSLAKQYGGDFGKALADASVAKALGTAPTAEETSAEVPASTEEQVQASDEMDA